ncbi:MAG: SNF2 helicase-associated domain-containing protein [Acidimicrobiales bacterium]
MPSAVGPVAGRETIVDPSFAIRACYDAIADRMVRSSGAAAVASSPLFAQLEPTRVPHLRPWVSDIATEHCAAAVFTVTVDPPDELVITEANIDQDSPLDPTAPPVPPPEPIDPGRQHWTLRFQLRSRQDPSLLVDAANLWNTPAEVLRLLGDQAEIDLLAGLRRAAAISPLFATSIDDARPTEVDFGDDDLDDFLDSLDALAEAGIEVRWPASLVAPSLDRRLVATSAAKGGGPAIGSLDDLLTVNWEYLLDGLALTADELEVLSFAKRSVVPIRAGGSGSTLPCASGSVSHRRNSRSARPWRPGSPEAGTTPTPATPPSRSSCASRAISPRCWRRCRPPGWVQWPRQASHRDCVPPCGHISVRAWPGCPTSPPTTSAVCWPTTWVWARPCRSSPSTPSAAGRPSSCAPPRSWRTGSEKLAGSFHRAGCAATTGPAGGSARCSRATSSSPPTGGAIRRRAPRDAALRPRGGRRGTADQERPFPLGTGDADAAVERTVRCHRHAHRESADRAVGADRLRDPRSPRATRPVPSRRRAADRARQRSIRHRAPRQGDGTVPVAPAQDRPGIAPELPAKIERNVIVPLTAEQASLYRATTEEVLADVQANEGLVRQGMVLKLLTALKQITNHPAHYLGQSGPLVDRSGKLDALDNLLDAAATNGEATLVFTQYRCHGRAPRRASR